MAEYILSVGLEVHAELSTQSKMFCRCKVAFGGEPNTRVCPVCIGLPGALPVPNRAAVEMVLKTALALNCQIARDSVFHRKNYFYPDLPKAYQISQYGETNPIGYYGYLDIPRPDGTTKRIEIARVHLEEDTGKLMHLPSGGSGIDFNRAGVPLMEIVTKFPPDVASPDEAKEYLAQLRQLLIFIGVCDGKMEEGSLRCEPNISVRKAGETKLGTKTELKNLSSFRSVQLGIQFEERRQIAVIEGGGKVLQETRGWNEASESSYAMRLKESENDYRYFPDPDLVPMHFSDELIEEVRTRLPELPLAKVSRYKSELGLSDYDAQNLVSDKPWSTFFEESLAVGGSAKQIVNLMSSELASRLNESGQVVQANDPHYKQTVVSPAHISEMAMMIESGDISSKIAKQIFDEMFTSGEMPKKIKEILGLTQVNDSAQIEMWVNEVIQENTSSVEKYKAGNLNIIGFLVGQVMKKSNGSANPPMVQEAMRKRLSE